MEEFMKCDIVVLPFPFSDLSASKKRPALVLAVLDHEDHILCQIISKVKDDKYSITLEETDFVNGSLKRQSFIRPNRLFTAHRSLILYKVGSIKTEKIKEVIAAVKSLLEK
ncbi:MAG: type II toxin-antitoxin system PemK/MazF family toxin [Candidatus Micrarchaeota archaeon]|nr:type II toxin-antitoxin system PemK/MazF family toxin [Candidatus Micrarchaeota archaeon]